MPCKDGEYFSRENNMGWSIGYDNRTHRDIGYGVPATCDLPSCSRQIDRGLSYLCGDIDSEHGCGLFFCEDHFYYRKPCGEDREVRLCPRCYKYRAAYKPKPDCRDWILHKLTHESWGIWRKENEYEVDQLKSALVK